MMVIFEFCVFAFMKDVNNGSPMSCETLFLRMLQAHLWLSFLGLLFLLRNLMMMLALRIWQWR